MKPNRWLSLGLILLGAGCARLDVGPEPGPWAECRNPQAGYVVRYPQTWYTNRGLVMPPCSVFHPHPFTLEAATEIPLGVAVALTVAEVPLETAAAFDDGHQVLARDEVQVAGRRALRVETLAGDDAPLEPPGVRAYRYFIPMEGRTLTASTYDMDGEPDYAAKKRIVDRMLQELSFRPWD